MLNARVEKNLTLGVRENFWAKQSRNKRKKKKIFWTVASVLNMNRLGYVEFWKIIPVFAQGK